MDSAYFEVVAHTYKSAYRDCNFRVMAIMQGILAKHYGEYVAQIVCDLLQEEVRDGEAKIYKVVHTRRFDRECGGRY